ncbi:MAG TPA: hypothetical protein VNX21_06215 [Candidatus Thermoplasmatota archaeon]|nr:hypothetical protein [Candidatus Thermoplasmatota archaeon]
MRARVLAPLGLCLLLLPLAGACPAYTTASMPTGGTYYVGSDGSVWMETNGVASLQCTHMVVGGRVFLPDTRISP